MALMTAVFWHLQPWCDKCEATAVTSDFPASSRHASRLGAQRVPWPHQEGSPLSLVRHPTHGRVKKGSCAPAALRSRSLSLKGVVVALGPQARGDHLGHAQDSPSCQRCLRFTACPYRIWGHHPAVSWQLASSLAAAPSCPTSAGPVPIPG